jgi:hypothetical protein
MTALLIAAVVFVCTIAAALLGTWLRLRLPSHHIADDSRDGIKLIMGLVSTMAALVLGLLIASSKNFYDTEKTELQTISVYIIKLDGVLAQFGEEADPARAVLHQKVEKMLYRYFPNGKADSIPVLARPNHWDETEMLRPLPGRTEEQRALKERAHQIIVSIGETRLLMTEQTGNALDWPFLVILIEWIVVLFLGFGVFTPLNGTVVMAVVIGASSAASAIFLILDLSMPFDGPIRISGEPLYQALSLIGR